MASDITPDNRSADQHDARRTSGTDRQSDPQSNQQSDQNQSKEVKQHNPDNQGVNPSQRGPAQPSKTP